MSHFFSLAALTAALPTALAVYQGFNYGALKPDGSLKVQADFENEFKVAQTLHGAPGVGFTSARLYTTIQGGTDIGPISAIPAAIATNTTLLLGIWASAGALIVDNELAALKNAINQYGDAFVRLVAGISVGSEDLYRNSPTGMANGENPGTDPNVLVAYIKKTRDTIAGTKLAGKPVGHVDTWTAWVNSSNQAVINVCDWVGMDAYPYFQSKVSNAIQYNKGLFDDALGQTQAAVGSKPVWITETGFPVTGNKSGDAVPSIENAKVFWDEVGCARFGYTNIWWYTLQDHSGPLQPGKVSFGVVGGSLTTTPLFDISCGVSREPEPEPRPNNPPPVPTTSKPAPTTSKPAPTTSSTAVIARSGAATDSPKPAPTTSSAAVVARSGAATDSLKPVPTTSSAAVVARSGAATDSSKPVPTTSEPIPTISKPAPTTSSAAVVAGSGAATDSSSSTDTTDTGYGFSTDSTTSVTATPSPANSTLTNPTGVVAISDRITASIGVAILAVVFAVLVV
ncbi:glucan endo-1,3-beta-glucosidase-like protein [Podospora fimiseda]|uniref:Probable glucan endo-1,3-beta-glucosidase eglC n=1 Tax=Podospora fimiseda TaxID=252190 RepID=A0AAN7BX36_9PEZI|nr:glucan endo-1,3-beta-glucosidase-like protein [Podospora fimiseda]